MACGIVCRALRPEHRASRLRFTLFLFIEEFSMFALHRFKASFVLASGLALTALLASCGSGSTFEPLVPTRVISFGDGLSDVGQTGSKFTVNDGTVNIWVERVATSYGRTLIASTTPGGLGYAQGNSRVSSGANPISNQISSFLASNTIGKSDLLIVDAGVAELAALAVDNPTDPALASAADAAGRALAAQVLRLTAAGAQHVVIANAPDLGKSPLATTAPARVAGLSAATRAFNDGLKIALATVTSGVLLIDNESYVNSIHNSPATLGLGGNVTTAACTGAVTACTGTANVVSNYGVYLYADDRHLAPTAHRLMGDAAYSKIKARW
jgi:outer membrane lipase/esterase